MPHLLQHLVVHHPRVALAATALLSYLAAKLHTYLTGGRD